MSAADLLYFLWGCVERIGTKVGELGVFESLGVVTRLVRQREAAEYSDLS